MARGKKKTHTHSQWIQLTSKVKSIRNQTCNISCQSFQWKSISNNEIKWEWQTKKEGKKKTPSQSLLFSFFSHLGFIFLSFLYSPWFRAVTAVFFYYSLVPFPILAGARRLTNKIMQSTFISCVRACVIYPYESGHTIDTLSVLCGWSAASHAGTENLLMVFSRLFVSRSFV